MSYSPVPAEGNIDLELVLDWAKLNNGEKRILTQETGLSASAMIHAVNTAGGDLTKVTDFDVFDLEYAFGRIALRRVHGPDADTPANADRVVCTISGAVDPTEAAS